MQAETYRLFSTREFIEFTQGKFPRETQEARRKSRFPERMVKGDLFYQATFDEAVNYFCKGYKVNTLEFKLEADRLTKALQPQISYRRDVTGSFFDVGEVLQNIPECWRKPVKQELKPELYIVIDITLIWYIQQIQRYNRGIAVATLINLLSGSYRLKLLFGMGTWHYPKHLPQYFDIEVSTNPLDIDLVNYLCCHNSATRRLCWSVEELLSGNPGYVTPISKCIGVNRRHYPANTIIFPIIQQFEYLTLDWTKARIQQIVNQYQK